MNKLLTLITYLIIFALGYLTATYIYSNNITMQEISLFETEGEAGVEWHNINEFLKTYESAFNVDMNAKIRGDKVNITVTTEKAGDLYLYGAVADTDTIYPLCSNQEFIDTGSANKYICENKAFAEATGDRLVFAFVTPSQDDHVLINRYLQLRTSLNPGDSYKGLNFNNAQVTVTPVSQAPGDNPVTESTKHNIGIAYQAFRD